VLKSVLSLGDVVPGQIHNGALSQVHCGVDIQTEQRIALDQEHFVERQVSDGKTNGE
jgi:hypothetical protein